MAINVNIIIYEPIYTYRMFVSDDCSQEMNNEAYTVHIISKVNDRI